MPFKRTYRKKSKKSTYRRKASSTALITTIKRVVNHTRELKTFQWGYQHLPLYSYSTGSNFAANNVIPLIPTSTSTPLIQGIGNSDRIGNEIRIKKATLKLTLYPTNYDATLNPQPEPFDVRLIILHAKNNPTNLIVSSTFFDQNNSTSSPQDDLQDQLSNINKDVYVVNRDKHYKIGSAINSASGVNQAWQHFANNDYKRNQMITLDVTNALPKSIVWDDTDTTPTSFQPNAVILISKANGVGLSADIEPIKYFMEMTIQYYDA